MPKRFEEFISEAGPAVTAPLAAISVLRREIALSARYKGRDDFREVEPDQHTKGGYTFEIRYWGNWVVPPDEEDDGDYDWKELSDDSAKKLDGIVRAVRAKYPNVKLTYSQEEKCWIIFYAS